MSEDRFDSIETRLRTALRRHATGRAGARHQGSALDVDREYEIVPTFGCRGYPT